jgi:hypothetical protein
MKFNYGIAIKALMIAAILGIPYLIIVGHIEPVQATLTALPSIFTAFMAWGIWKMEIKTT